MRHFMQFCAIFRRSRVLSEFKEHILFPLFPSSMILRKKFAKSWFNFGEHLCFLGKFFSKNQRNSKNSAKIPKLLKKNRLQKFKKIWTLLFSRYSQKFPAQSNLSVLKRLNFFISLINYSK